MRCCGCWTKGGLTLNTRINTVGQQYIAPLDGIVAVARRIRAIHAAGYVHRAAAAHVRTCGAGHRHELCTRPPAARVLLAWIDPAPWRLPVQAREHVLPHVVDERLQIFLRDEAALDDEAVCLEEFRFFLAHSNAQSRRAIDVLVSLDDREGADLAAASLHAVAEDDLDAWTRLARYYATTRQRSKQVEAERRLAELRAR